MRIFPDRTSKPEREFIHGLDDGRLTLEYDDYYVMQPQFKWCGEERKNGGKPVEEGFVYSIERNCHALNVLEIKKIIQEFSNGEDGHILRAANN